MAYISLFIGFILSVSSTFFGIPKEDEVIATVGVPAAVHAPLQKPENGVIKKAKAPENIPIVPFYSQFHDISAPEWKKLGCGIADLAMLIEFYKPGSVSVDTLLSEGITSGAFINGAGWSHRGLVLLAETYGLRGINYDFSHLNTEAAFAQFETILNEGPVIVSVYYRFDTQSTIPHLVVINGIDSDTVYYNDPSSGRGGEEISISDFKRAWKKRLIIVRQG